MGIIVTGILFFVIILPTHSTTTDLSYVGKTLSTSQFQLKVNTFVSPFEDELNPTDVVKVGQNYSVTAKVARSNEHDSSSLIHYVLLISIKDQRGKVVVTSWSYGKILQNESSSYGGIYWTPHSGETYTIESFVWASLTGTPLAESSQNDIHVTE